MKNNKAGYDKVDDDRVGSQRQTKGPSRETILEVTIANRKEATISHHKRRMGARGCATRRTMSRDTALHNQGEHDVTTDG